MSEHQETLWTIDELGTQVALALSEGYKGQSNGRVRDVPDQRTIRYYTTLGILDRPADRRGRTALYNQRHLLQLVAIKRLQTRGQTLVEIQEKLVGLTNSDLRRIAKIAGPSDEQPRIKSGSSRTSRKEREGFWRDVPEFNEQCSDDSEHKQSQEPSDTGVSTIHGVRLTDNVNLLLETDRPLEEEDVEAIRVVAEPLLKLLEKRRLISRRERKAP